MPAPGEGEPEFAALVFFDEITRGDASLCKFSQILAVRTLLPACLPACHCCPLPLVLELVGFTLPLAWMAGQP